MVRERRELGRGIVAMELLHDGADARVQPYPVGRRKLVVECLANQCVCETILTRADRLADDDLACQRGAERLEERVTVDAARSLQDREVELTPDRKSTRLNSSHLVISYAVFCLKKKKKYEKPRYKHSHISTTTN